MKTLDRYIGVSVAKGYVIVLAVLLPVFSFLLFVNELEDVGKGTYDALGGLLYVLLTAPGRMLELTPVAALLGGIVALGGLAAGSELMAVRAAGVSVMRIGGAVMKASLALMLLVIVLAQFVVPPLNQLAERRRSMAVTGAGTFLKDKGFWSRDGLRYINVRHVLHGRIPVDVEIYEFDPHGRLRTFLHARRADIENPHRWKLIDVQRKRFDGQRVQDEHLRKLDWKPFLSETQVRVLELPATTLSPLDTYQYARHLRDTGQAAEHAELRFWQQATLPLTTGAMTLLSLPFVFGALRSASFGKRLALGAVLGVGFHLVNQIAANLGLLLGISAPLIALTPILALFLLVLLVMRRIR